MVWFSEETVSLEMMYEHYLSKLSSVPLEEGEESSTPPTMSPPPSGRPMTTPATHGAPIPAESDTPASALQVQKDAVNVLSPYFAAEGLVTKALEFSMQSLEHIMDLTRMRALNSLFAMINQAIKNVLNYNHHHTDFPMQVHFTIKFITFSYFIHFL